MSADPRDLTPLQRAAAAEALEPSAFGQHRRQLVLFALTVFSVFQCGAVLTDPNHDQLFTLDPAALARGASFALPLLAILITHELGHYVAARLHRVPASLPYFLPLPIVPPGTLGAVIAMRDRIRSRNALLDIGAAGPIAGMIVALPVLAWGLSLSAVEPNPAFGYQQEGQSLLYIGLKYLVVGPIPDGHDVWLHPTAFAGWWGLLLTMVNLLPWGQLDGGHIAYALVGERHHAIARWLRRGLLVVFAVNLLRFGVPILLGTSSMSPLYALMNSMSWLVWYFVLGLLSKLAGGSEHPPFEPGPLSPARRAVGWFCIALFVVLFMPTPMTTY